MASGNYLMASGNSVPKDLKGWAIKKCFLTL